MNDVFEFFLDNEATLFVAVAIICFPMFVLAVQFVEAVFGWPEDVSPRVKKAKRQA